MNKFITFKRKFLIYLIVIFLLILPFVYSDVVVINGNSTNGMDKYCNGPSCTNDNALHVGNTNSFIFFNFSQITDITKANLIEAKLSLYSTSHPSSSPFVDITRLTSVWNETDNSLPTFVNYISLTINPLSSTNNQYQNYTLTNLVNETLNGTYVNLGWSLNTTNTTVGSALDFSSKDNPPPDGSGWYWTITYNSLPTTTSTSSTSSTSTTLPKTIRIGVSRDTYCGEGNGVTLNCVGHNTELYVGNISYPSINSGAMLWYFSMLYFEINSTYQNKDIQNVELYLSPGLSNTMEIITTLVNNTVNWTEGPLSGAPQPSNYTNVIYNISKIGQNGQIFSINITEMFRAWNNGTFDNQGLRINISNSPNEWNTTDFVSSIDSPNPPYILVTFGTATTTSTSSTSSTTSSSTSSSTTTSTTTSSTSTTLPHATIDVWMNGFNNQNVTVYTNNTVNTTAYLTVNNKSFSMFIDGVFYLSSVNPLSSFTSFTTDKSYNVTFVFLGDSEYQFNSTTLWYDVIATTTTTSTSSSSSTSTSSTSSTSTSSTTETTTTSTTTLPPTTTTSSSTTSTTLITQTTGDLYVASNPSGARIYLDDVYKGTTNRTITLIHIGDHSLKINRTGYLDYFGNVTINPGQITYVNAILRNNVGLINVSSIPKGSFIYLNGVYKGTTNVVLTNIVPGDYNVKLNKTGYSDFFTNITVYFNQTSYVSPILQDIMGNISVTSNPKLAFIYLNGVYKGVTNNNLTKLLPKVYNLKVNKTGYQDYFVNVTVLSGQTSYVNPMLEDIMGNLSVTSNPKGAFIYLNGIYKGTTNRNLTKLLPKDYVLKVNKTGYYDYFTNVTVLSEQTSFINALLQPI